MPDEIAEQLTASKGQAGILQWARRGLKNSAKSGFFILTVLVAWILELIYGLSSSSWPDGLRTFTILWFGSGAAFFLGSIGGFLFGIPKSQPSTEKYNDNTNLEEVSDWLTKLIIGIGLIEMEKIVAFVAQCGAALGKAIDPSDQFGGSAIGTGAIVVGFATGFLHYYMWARIIVAETLSKANKSS